MDRGFFWIGIVDGFIRYNVGTLWRTAYSLGANQIFTVNARYTHQESDTIGAWQYVPLVRYRDMEDLIDHFPMDTALVGIEQHGKALEEFEHPPRAVYLLGAEDVGMARHDRELCDTIVRLAKHLTDTGSDPI